MLLFGGGYHVVLWAVGNVAFPAQAEGSLIRRADGTVVGSRLIAQKFTKPEYFRARPSGGEPHDHQREDRERRCPVDPAHRGDPQR